MQTLSHFPVQESSKSLNILTVLWHQLVLEHHQQKWHMMWTDCSPCKIWFCCIAWIIQTHLRSGYVEINILKKINCIKWCGYLTSPCPVYKMLILKHFNIKVRWILQFFELEKSKVCLKNNRNDTMFKQKSQMYQMFVINHITSSVSGFDCLQKLQNEASYKVFQQLNNLDSISDGFVFFIISTLACFCDLNLFCIMISFSLLINFLLLLKYKIINSINKTRDDHISCKCDQLSNAWRLLLCHCWFILFYLILYIYWYIINDINHNNINVIIPIHFKVAFTNIW